MSVALIVLGTLNTWLYWGPGWAVASVAVCVVVLTGAAVIPRRSSKASALEESETFPPNG